MPCGAPYWALPLMPVPRGALTAGWALMDADLGLFELTAMFELLGVPSLPRSALGGAAATGASAAAAVAVAAATIVPVSSVAAGQWGRQDSERTVGTRSRTAGRHGPEWPSLIRV